ELDDDVSVRRVVQEVLTRDREDGEGDDLPLRGQLPLFEVAVTASGAREPPGRGHEPTVGAAEPSELPAFLVALHEVVDRVGGGRQGIGRVRPPLTFGKRYARNTNRRSLRRCERGRSESAEPHGPSRDR